MNIKNLNPIISEKKEIKAEHNNSNLGITKRLLEKYKPKGLYNVEKIYDRKELKEVA